MLVFIYFYADLLIFYLEIFFYFPYYQLASTSVERQNLLLFPQFQKSNFNF